VRTVLNWAAQAEARTPAGAVACGAVVHALVARLRRYEETDLSALSLVATRDIVVVLGREDALPWVDGLRYCAPAAAAPDLWLPTQSQPTNPVDLLQRALESAAQCKPLLLWDAPEQIVPLDAPLQATPALLAWLARELG
jgi:hypothetical protein